jgi:hypothetical protein
MGLMEDEVRATHRAARVLCVLPRAARPHRHLHRERPVGVRACSSAARRGLSHPGTSESLTITNHH